MNHWQPNPESVDLIDERCRQWSQGDVALGRGEFLHSADLRYPLTGESAQLCSDAEPGESLAAVLSGVEGLALLTQTCDLVRSCARQPYVEVAPLVTVSEEEHRDIRAGRRPGYAHIPSLDSARMVADLHRVMTIEKALLLGMQPHRGCLTDSDRRKFALALARKRSRFAFPDDFVALSGKLQDRLRAKHNRDSEEGRALRSLDEIRVTAAPSWDAQEVQLFFWFVLDDRAEKLSNEVWDRWLPAWLDLLQAQERFVEVSGAVVALDDMTARDYVESEPFDMDYLSS